MRVAVGSMWRDSERYVQHALFQQFDALGAALKRRGDDVSFLFVENDSTDRTFYWLNEFGGCGHHMTTLLRKHDDCPYWDSVDHPDRWRHLAWVANGTLELLEEVSRESGEFDRFLYVESDLLWEVDDILRLIDDPGAVCAMNMRYGSDRYYDIWGTRARVNFGTHPPYHPDFNGEPMLIDSACGATCVPADVALKARFQPEDCYVGWCRQIRDHMPLWLLPEVKVYHP